MFRLIFCCLTVALVGCAGPSKTRLPGGETGYELTCPGSTWESCEKKAEELCAAAGYQVVTRYEDYSRRSVPRSMLITCNPPVSREPLEDAPQPPVEDSPEAPLEDSPEAALEDAPQEGNCCAELEKLSQECRHDVAGSRFVMLSDPLEIALIEAVRSALPRSELEALVRMLGQRAPE